MTVSDRSFNDIDMDREDKKKHTRRVILIVLLALIVVVSFVLYLEITGSRGGEFIDRITVSSYLKRNYGSEAGKFSIKYTGYNQVRSRYEYECTCDKGTFMMASSQFKVRYDGYYAEFKCDSQAEKAVEAYLKDYVASRWDDAEKGATWTLTAKIRIPLSEGDNASDSAAMLEKYGDTLELEASLKGNKLTFGEYKSLSYDFLDTLRSSMKVAPEFMQIFYYRFPDDSDRDTEQAVTDAEGNILSYESHLLNYMFNFNKQGYTSTDNVNFVVELGDKEKSSLRNYTIIRVVNFVIIGLAVVGLLILYFVRRSKKNKKRRIENESNEGYVDN